MEAAARPPQQGVGADVSGPQEEGPGGANEERGEEAVTQQGGVENQEDQGGERQ